MAEPHGASGLILRMDPWATEYASALQLEQEDMEEREVEVDPTVETSTWAPVSRVPTFRPASIVFVDGVQRIEARVLAEAAGDLVYGAFASVAVGAVRSVGTATIIEAVKVHRILALTGEVATDPTAVECGSTVLRFAPRWSTKPGYLGVAEAIDGQRRELEMELGQKLVEAGHPLVLVDGRLRLFPSPHTAVVGYAKTLHRRYLSPPYAAVLPRLQAGERCPLFQIEEQRPLYSWYLRLSSGRPIDHPLAGLVRLETTASIGLERAIELADQTAAELPRFASTPERDPRAPQNLLPIGGLELHLKHEMGDHTWLRRAIESHLYRTAG